MAGGGGIRRSRKFRVDSRSPGGSGPGGGAAPDLRLAGAAMAAWLTTLAVLGWSAPAGYAIGGTALAVCVALLTTWRSRYCRALAVVALVIGCAGAAAVATAIRVGARDASPVRVLAGERATAVLDLAVIDDPRPVASHGPGPPQVIVPARVQRVSSHGRTWVGSARVVVLAPAESWKALLPSQHLQATGRLSPPTRDDLTAAVVAVNTSPGAVGPPSLAQRGAGRLRAGLREAVSGLPDGVRGLLPGLVDGDRGGIDPVLAERFRTAGLTHLISVSGTNVAIIAGAVLLLLRAMTVGPRASAVLAGAALVGFVVLARPSPSVLRAAVMGGIALIALASGRPRSAIPGLSAAVLILMLTAPSLAREPGFALSVLATAALLLLAPSWARWLRRRGVPGGVAEALAVPAAAHLVTAPVIAALSGTVSLVAIPANLLAAPAVAPATVLGVLAAVVAPMWMSLARVVAWLAGLPAGWIVAVAERGATLPGASLPWPAGLAGGVALIGAFAVAVWVVRARAVRRTLLAGAVGAAVVVVPVRVAAPAWPPPGWVLVMCDVGQGDALVLNAGRDSAVVVDTGPEPVAVDGCLRRLHITRIPLLVLTHLHADHVGGLDGALRQRAVGAIEIGPLHEPSWAWHELQADATSQHLPLWSGSVGEVREVDDLRLQVLAPRTAAHGTRSDPNNSSLVLKVAIHGIALLLTGDAEVESQDAMLRDGDDVHADVLKVPHHGSAWQSEQFLARVHPSIALISVGAGNDYGHPSPAVIADLAHAGVRVLRTDQCGDIAVAVIEGALRVTTRTRSPPSC
jgi:competence protein ComEC